MHANCRSKVAKLLLWKLAFLFLALFSDQDESMVNYCKLAHAAVTSGELLWPGRPKHHVPVEFTARGCCFPQIQIVFLSYIYIIYIFPKMVLSVIRGGKSFNLQKPVTDSKLRINKQFLHTRFRLVLPRCFTSNSLCFLCSNQRMPLLIIFTYTYKFI